jgi:hypothetical protein
MKPLILALLLAFTAFDVADAQTPVVVSDSNIKECFKRSSKAPFDFDRCVADEFRRVREDKEYREARVRVEKDPYGGCGKTANDKACLAETMADLRQTRERLDDGTGSGSVFHFYHWPRLPSYRYRLYSPYRYLRPRTHYPVYPRFYVPPRLRHWRY